MPNISKCKLLSFWMVWKTNFHIDSYISHIISSLSREVQNPFHPKVIFILICYFQKSVSFPCSRPALVSNFCHQRLLLFKLCIWTLSTRGIELHYNLLTLIELASARALKLSQPGLEPACEPTALSLSHLYTPAIFLYIRKRTKAGREVAFQHLSLLKNLLRFRLLAHKRT